MNARTGFLLAAVVLLVAIGALSSFARPDHGQRNHEIFTEMAYSVAPDPWSPNEYFADGKTVQPLVAGVVPRGAAPFSYGAGPEEALRAGDELVNPVAADDPEIATRGAELYRVHCLSCHDARGNGKGPVVLRGMLPPPSLHAARALSLRDGELFHIITRGQGNMADYAAELSGRERWLVVRWMRRLQEEGP